MFRVASNGVMFSVQRKRRFLFWTWWVNPVNDGMMFWSWGTFPGGTPIPQMLWSTAAEAAKWIAEEEAKIKFKNHQWRPIQ